MRKNRLVLAAVVLAAAGIMTGCTVSDSDNESNVNIVNENGNGKQDDDTGNTGEKVNSATENNAQPKTEDIMEDWKKRMDQIRYSETDSEGKSLTIFAYYTSNKCVVTVTNDDGSKNKYYIDSKLLYDLKTFDDSENMTSWQTIGPNTPEADKDVQIRVECRIVNRDYKFGTNHMPDKNGIEKLHSIRDMILAEVGEDNEIKPFTVVIGGKEYNTVSGTGNIVGTGAIIDFGEDKWWQVMGYVGRFELTDTAREWIDGNGNRIANIYDMAYIEIKDDGSLELKVDDIEQSGNVDPEVGYGVWATALGRGLEMCFEEGDGIEENSLLHIMMQPEPVPGTFEGFDLVLERIK